MLFEARGVAGVMALMIGLLVVQIVTVWALGIEPRHRSLEELEARRDGAGAGQADDLTAPFAPPDQRTGGASADRPRGRPGAFWNHY